MKKKKENVVIPALLTWVVGSGWFWQRKHFNWYIICSGRHISIEALLSQVVVVACCLLLSETLMPIKTTLSLPRPHPLQISQTAQEISITTLWILMCFTPLLKIILGVPSWINKANLCIFQFFQSIVFHEKTIKMQILLQKKMPFGKMGNV